MSKRGGEQNNSPKKRFKEHKDASVSDSENDAVDETTISLSATYAPDEMRRLLESFVEFSANIDSSMKNIEKVAADWAEKFNAESNEIIDVTVFCADFRRYMRESLRINNLDIIDAAKITHKHLSREKSLGIFSDFPHKPQPVLQIYIGMKNLSKNFSNFGAALEMMKNESQEVTDKLNEEHKNQELNYISELEAFLNAHKFLTEEQKTSIELKLKNMRKKFKPKDTPVRRSAAKKPKKEPATAFSVWMKTQSKKYLDRSEEERETKLRRKFEKLSDAEKRLLEDLAMNS